MGSVRRIPLSRPRWQLVKTAHGPGSGVTSYGAGQPRPGALRPRRPSRLPDAPGRAARGPDNGREQGRSSRGLSARLAAIETGPAAPSRPQPGTTNPSKRRRFSFEGFVVPQGGRRASGRRGGSGSDAEHLARQSPKNVAQARRSLGRAGAADRGDPPQPAMAAGVARCHRRVLRRPNSGTLSDATARTLRTRRVAMPIGKVRPGHREAAQGGGCKRALERTALLKGGLQPPPGRRDHEAPRPQDGTGSTHSASDFVRPATSAGSRTRRTRAGAGGRGRGQPGGWRRSTQPRGAPGDRPGAANDPWKERSFQGRFAAPRAVQGSKPCSNGLAPRSPATRARISSKAASPAESQGKSAEWRCIHAHFPVKNQVIP